MALIELRRVHRFCSECVAHFQKDIECITEAEQSRQFKRMYRNRIRMLTHPRFRDCHPHLHLGPKIPIDDPIRCHYAWGDTVLDYLALLVVEWMKRATCHCILAKAFAHMHRYTVNTRVNLYGKDECWDVVLDAFMRLGSAQDFALLQMPNHALDGPQQMVVRNACTLLSKRVPFGMIDDPNRRGFPVARCTVCCFLAVFYSMLDMHMEAIYVLERMPEMIIMHDLPRHRRWHALVAFANGFVRARVGKQREAREHYARASNIDMPLKGYMEAARDWYCTNTCIE